MPAQLLFNAHDDCHDRTWAAIANIAQANADNAFGHIQNFNSGAIHLQGGSDLVSQSLDNALFYVIGFCLR